MPGEGSVAPTFTQPADRQQIQEIQDDMAECLGVALVITDTAGHFITQPSRHAATCLHNAQPTPQCAIVRMAIDSGLVAQAGRALYLSCCGFSHILVPIRARGALLGMMVATHPHDSRGEPSPANDDCVLRPITPEDASPGPLSREKLVAVGNLLNSVANRLVELDLKHQLADQRMRELAAVNEASAVIASTLDLHLLPDVVVQKASELQQAEYSFLALLNKNTGELGLVATVGMPEAAREHMRIRLGEGPIGRVAQTGEPILQNDATLHALVAGSSVSQPPSRASVLCLPLKAKGEILGVLGVASTVHRFEPERQWILDMLANQATIALLNARLYDEAQQSLQKLNRLFELGAEINSIHHVDEVLQEINRHALEATQGMACNITLIDDDGRIKVRAAVGFSPHINQRIIVRPNGLSMQVKRSGQPSIIPDVLAAADIVNPVMIQAGVRAALCLPLRVKDRVIGVVWVHYAQARPFLQSDINLLLAFANQAAVAIDNAQLREELVKQATRDGKTGLFNHDFFFARLRLEMEKARRTDSPLSLIMIDIDHFKEYNDTFGHLKGDESLHAVADAIVSRTRKSDLVARYGGEEFAVLLPGTDAEHAMEIAERIRIAVGAVSQKLTPSAGLPNLTVSLGVAGFPRSASTENELIERADRALYQAKARGKNVVSVFSS